MLDYLQKVERLLILPPIMVSLTACKRDYFLSETHACFTFIPLGIQMIFIRLSVANKNIIVIKIIMEVDMSGLESAFPLCSGRVKNSTGVRPGVGSLKGIWVLR